MLPPLRRLALLLALAAVLPWPRPAQAIRLPAGARSEAERDARRFGLQRPAARRFPSQRSRRAFADFNRTRGGGWRMRFNERTGAPAALVEGRTAPRRGTAEAAASAFLTEAREVMQLDPASLVLERRSQGRGMAHILYRQTYRGLPVEFARVKVHVNEDGAILGAHSNYEPELNLGAIPTLTATQAAESVRRDNGRPPADAGTLVVLPDLGSGRGARLAWKFTAPGSQAVWRYYVDARTGAVIFRYNDLRFACPGASGTISGMVYPVSPGEGAAVQKPFPNANVYVGDGSTWAVTDGQGSFCHGQAGKIITSLQGPWVTVANFRGPSAHYDNGDGAWNPISYDPAISSPDPYPPNSVITSTIDISAAAPAAVKFLPVFSKFDVGTWLAEPGMENGDITDDDQVAIFDANWNPVASYIGNRLSFNAAAVHGQKLFLRLRSNGQDGGQHGYDVTLSSYLVLNSPHATNPAGSDLVWQKEMPPAGLRGEISIFYHLNQLHDYFMSDVNRSSAAWLGRPANAMAFVGPGMNNAFYNPLQDNLSFGDGGDPDNPSDIVTDDATVPRHEYTHYVVEKIWPITNFGQAGAISEGSADYWSGSSLDRSSIGKHYNGGTTPLRELDSTLGSDSCGNSPAILSSSSWQGYIHCDSRFLSQALWDIRRNRIAAQGFAAGRSCADGLAFQSLLFFPESFQEFLDAMKRVDAENLVSACGGPGVVQSTITAAFAGHGIGAYGANDGFETAVDVSTRHAVSAAIYPAGDVHFYTFGAGAGPMRFALTLPQDPSGYYKAYILILYDRDHEEVARAEPPYDGNNTQDAICNSDDCTTSASQVVLTYVNPPAGQFFIQVAGGVSIYGSNSGVNSTIPYGLELVYPQAGAFPGTIVTAAYDRDEISSTVTVTNFPRTTGPGGPGGQDYSFAYAQLRDHAYNAIPLADTRLAGAGFLALVSSVSAGGRITARLALQPGFAGRYPAKGTVYLEVFGCNVVGSTVSLGLSPPLYLTANQAQLTAYNNIFNPTRGEKATIKYEILDPGHVTLRLFTLSGTRVATLIDEDRPAGKGSVDWAGLNLSGSTVASGIYLLHLSAPGIHKTQKIVVVK